MVDVDAVLARIDERTEHMQERIDALAAEIDDLRGVAHSARSRVASLLDRNGSSDLERRVDARIREHEEARAGTFREWGGFIFGLISLLVAAFAVVR